MSSNDEEFYKLSKYLLDSSAENPLIAFKNCSIRTSISRAFYFSYHKLITLISYLFKIDIREYTQTHKQGTHIAIVKILEKNGLGSLAYGYNRLRDFRTKSDYKLSFNIPLHYAQTCIEISEDIADEIDEFLDKVGYLKNRCIFLFTWTQKVNGSWTPILV